jgi:hypothetical protein
MTGILYENDGENITIVEDIEYKIPKNDIFTNIPNNTLLVSAVNSFGFTFTEFKNIEKFCEVINEYESKYNKIDNILIDFNKIIFWY